LLAAQVVVLLSTLRMVVHLHVSVEGVLLRLDAAHALTVVVVHVHGVLVEAFVGLASNALAVAGLAHDLLLVHLDWLSMCLLLLLHVVDEDGVWLIDHALLRTCTGYVV
jgi:hypothetical protein